MKELFVLLALIGAALIPVPAQADTNFATAEVFLGGSSIGSGQDVADDRDSAFAYGGALTIFGGDSDATFHWGFRVDGTYQKHSDQKDLFLVTGPQLDLEIPIANFLLIPYAFAGGGYQFKKVPASRSISTLSESNHAGVVAVGGGAKVPLLADFAFLHASVLYYRSFNDNEANNIRYVAGAGVSF